MALGRKFFAKVMIIVINIFKNEKLKETRIVVSARRLIQTCQKNCWTWAWNTGLAFFCHFTLDLRTSNTPSYGVPYSWSSNRSLDNLPYIIVSHRCPN